MQSFFFNNYLKALHYVKSAEQVDLDSPPKGASINLSFGKSWKNDALHELSKIYTSILHKLLVKAFRA